MLPPRPFLCQGEGNRSELSGPAAPPAARAEPTKDDADSDDDDEAKADAMMKKMLKQGQDFLDRQKQK